MSPRDNMRSDELQEHIFSSYLHLRYGAAIIGVLLPVIVYGVGRLKGVPLADSISDYYWVPDGPEAPSRDWFVGCLFAVAAILYLYKGFSKAENVALNLAALLAAGVALIPTAGMTVPPTGSFPSMAFVQFRCSFASSTSSGFDRATRWDFFLPVQNPAPRAIVRCIRSLAA